MMLYSAIKKSERMSFAGKLMQLKMVILNKTSQTQTNIGCFLSFVDLRLYVGAENHLCK